MNLADLPIAAAATLPEEREAISELFEVMRELKDAILAENALLDSGMPAALSDVSELKALLAEEFQERSSEVLASHARQIAADPDLGRRLIEEGQELRRLTQANMERLAGALAATRRRVDAVMAAIHDHNQENRTYAKNRGPGLAIGAQFVDYGVNYKI